MKNKNITYLVIIIILIVVIAIAALIMHSLPQGGYQDQTGTMATTSMNSNSSSSSNANGTGSGTYVNSRYGFSIMYPTSLQRIGPENAGDIDSLNTDDVFIGRVPDTAFKGTNLREVTIVAGGKKTDQNTCLNKMAGNNVTDQGGKPEIVKINGIDFTKVNVRDAGAGNFYNTTRYSVYRADTCYEVLAVAHSVNLGNIQDSEPGVKQYSNDLYMPEFTGIVSSFHFLAS